MKNMFFSFFLFISFSLVGQNKGFIFYQNVEDNKKIIEEIGKHGLKIQIQSKLVSLDYLTEVNSMLEDYKNYIKTWYKQINSIEFLDNEHFAKFNTKNMRVQTLCYIQYKNKDYKWGGCKYFEIFEISSNLYFTPFVKEYSDRFEMEVIVAEQFN